MNTKALEMEKQILARYEAGTGISKILHERAKKVFPGGVTRNIAHLYPYPTFMEKGGGCWLYDYDGNKYLDLLNDYTAILHGHNDADITAAAGEQLQKGTILTAPSRLQTDFAELLCSRIESMDQIRFANSGTEATFYAIRLARAFTQKPKFIKMDFGFHGSHDAVEWYAGPDCDDRGLPLGIPENPGIPESTRENVVFARFNDLPSVELALTSHKGQIAALIVEPVLGTGGVIPPAPGFLEGCRRLADQYEALLIFDEIVSLRFAEGGFQSLAGVKPDLTTIGKIIGGGFAIGAFGGRKDIMALVDPNLPEGQCISHSGTFTGANIVMAAGLAAMKKYDSAAASRLNALGDRLRVGISHAFQKTGIRGQATGYGSVLGIHWTDAPIVTGMDAMIGQIGSGNMATLLNLELLNRGVCIYARGGCALSTPTTEVEIDHVIRVFEETLEMLKPCAENQGLTR
ncbi:MAG: aminotransferase class III-fold pyridoxal phosphate-dependent enzyme [Proteobacteria bacterium]|nr:aminotransferase class III-fold pyridoxal phosphate-dependent enzyme [Pseudomonadota bacterium]